MGLEIYLYVKDFQKTISKCGYTLMFTALAVTGLLCLHSPGCTEELETCWGVLMTLEPCVCWRNQVCAEETMCVLNKGCLWRCINDLGTMCVLKCWWPWLDCRVPQAGHWSVQLPGKITNKVDLRSDLYWIKDPDTLIETARIMFAGIWISQASFIQIF